MVLPRLRRPRCYPRNFWKKSKPLQLMKERPDIFSYHDYRVFLKDWFEFRKQEGKGFSVRSVARDAKLGSGYLPMVLAGERNLSPKALAKS